ncbi:hypothetical protein PARPLA_01099 [Rhodobacteraceae bacterium THAF1]|uniref:DUF1127 domain-containing protein n=1 Tax=Palleronia sp. THAF1 TaxID=2587842 RepID=UPI000F3D0834|nr:DUF1127 domain-containing protein [Palleronia sp. THAF1]QFU07378.1 hypothetical protein FIU81_01685 [Palleronia sp. THAF1]VDC20710.1 hypothetical protein PARPLA_01099 [Rhodobacteraceae bacterium THAF1]
MALYDTHRSTATPTSTVLATRIADLILNVGDRLSAIRLPRRSALRLSDRELRDLGLERYQAEHL